MDSIQRGEKFVNKNQVRIQNLCKVGEGGQVRFCRYRAAESRWQQTFKPQNLGAGGGGQPPLDPYLRMFSKDNRT